MEQSGIESGDASLAQYGDMKRKKYLSKLPTPLFLP